MPKLWVVSPEPNHEDVFLQRYDRLLGQALHITGRSHSAAEDLVHDAFIQFTLSQPDLTAINDLDSYLFIVLRNMHLSQVRRTSQVQFASISIADYDSAEIGLRAMDIQSQIQVSEELLRICNYTCIRKESSKAASVLILRFFHGYYTSEIADVIRAPRRTVHEWLRIARNEVRLYLDNPSALTFLGNGVVEEVPVRTVLTGRDLLGELRELIFSSRRGACLSSHHLEELYREREGATIECKTLAHIVSCPRCLDDVNKMQGLPPFSDRYPTDMLGPETRSPSGGNEMNRGTQAGDPTTNNMNLCRRRLGEVLDHQPQALSFSANGFILGSQKVSSEITEQLLSINIDEEINFVEVFSEQGIRLMFMGVMPSSSGGVEQKARLALDEGRDLECVLSFSSPWPTLHVTYRDLSLKTDGPITVTDLETQPIESALEAISPEAISEPSTLDNPESQVSAVEQLRRHWFNLGFWLRPGMVTAVSALILVATLAIWFTRTPKPVVVTAGDLLDRATATEQSVAAQTGTVIHRSINLEEKSATGVVIARNRIEIWQSADRGLEVRRLYDERGILVAGDWRRNDGVQTLYHHGSDPRIQLAPEKRGFALLGFDEIWQLSPSAKEFSSLIANTEHGRVEDGPSGYRISYEGQSSGVANLRLVTASLTLNRSDLHAVDQTLLIQQGNDLREYRFVEASFERHRVTSVETGIFEPDPALVTERVKPETGMKRAVTPVALPEIAPPAMATPQLEVEVLRLLNLIDADMGEQIVVRRTASGILQVDGVVDTPERKQEILRALGPVSQNPAFRANVETVTERVAREQRTESSAVTLAMERIEPTENAIPLESELRRYFLARGVAKNQIDDEIQRFCRVAMGHSSRALQHAGALVNLTGRFSPDELRTINAETRANWLELIHKHAQALRQSIAALRSELFAPLGQSAGTSVAEVSLDDDRKLVQAVNQLFSMCSSIDSTVRSALSLSTDTSQATAIKGAHFWRSLADSEDVAAKIAATK